MSATALNTAADDEWDAKFADYLLLSVELELAKMGTTPDKFFKPEYAALFKRKD